MVTIIFYIYITCGTGSFATETTCMTESLYEQVHQLVLGAVAVVGTAQSYTHTAFNNIVNMGIFDGIFFMNHLQLKHTFTVN